MATLDTEQGLNLPVQAELIKSFVDEINDKIDPTFVIDNRNLLASMIVILSQKLNDLYETLGVCFDIVGGEGTTGDNLLDFCRWVGIKPKEAQPTRVYLMLSAAKSTVVPTNTTLTSKSFTITNNQAININPDSCIQAVISVSDAQYNTQYAIALNGIEISYTANPSDTTTSIATALQAAIIEHAPLFRATVDQNQLTITRTVGGDVNYFYTDPFKIKVLTTDHIALNSFGALGYFDNSVTGPINIQAGIFTLDKTPIEGVSTVQKNDAVVGSDAESDQDLRIRRNQSVAYGGSRTFLSIQAGLLATNYVQKAVVYQNVSDYPKVIDNQGDVPITLLPHSIYAVVLGGYAPEVAQTIFNRMSEGIETNGNTGVTITLNNQPEYDYTDYQLIKFDFAEQIDIDINISITVDGSVFYKVNKNAEAVILNNIVDYMRSLGIGETLYIDSMTSVAGCAVEYGIKDIEMNYTLRSNNQSYTTDLKIRKNQVVVADPNNIKITLKVG
jgi:hypothetical protein